MQIKRTWQYMRESVKIRKISRGANSLQNDTVNYKFRQTYVFEARNHGKAYFAYYHKVNLFRRGEKSKHYPTWQTNYVMTYDSYLIFPILTQEWFIKITIQQKSTGSTQSLSPLYSTKLSFVY